MISMIESGHRLVLPAKMPGHLYQLIYKCWSYEPNERPTFPQLVASVRSLIDNYNEGSSNTGSVMLPPTKPPRPPHFGTSSSRNSFRSSVVPNLAQNTLDDMRQEELQRNLEEQRQQSQADGMWVKKQQGEERFSYIPIPSSSPLPRKNLPPINIDRSNDEVYKALTALVQKIMDINQILEKVIIIIQCFLISAQVSNADILIYSIISLLSRLGFKRLYLTL